MASSSIICGMLHPEENRAANVYSDFNIIMPQNAERRTQKSWNQAESIVCRTQKSTIRRTRTQNAEAKQIEVARAENTEGDQAANVLSTKRVEVANAEYGNIKHRT